MDRIALNPPWRRLTIQPVLHHPGRLSDGLGVSLLFAEEPRRPRTAQVPVPVAPTPLGQHHG